jgi:hypothetical protein
MQTKSARIATLLQTTSLSPLEISREVSCDRSLVSRVKRQLGAPAKADSLNEIREELRQHRELLNWLVKRASENQNPRDFRHAQRMRLRLPGKTLAG